MFVDTGYADLLATLAPGGLFVAPSIIDRDEPPPFGCQPTAAFARGAFSLQRRQGNPVEAVRFHRRMAFYLGVHAVWRPVVLSVDELRRAEGFVDPAARRHAQAVDRAVRVRRIGRGEAECAAVAATRGWALWSDDAAIVALLGTLNPGHPIERITDLLARAVREGRIACEDAADLYNGVFKGRLGLWTDRTLVCVGGVIVVG